MFVLDTNIWLELLLQQEKADEVRQFMETADPADLAISEFSLYSIAVILSKLDRHDLLDDFLSDVVIGSGVVRIALNGDELREVLMAMSKFGLTFDDAYQYVSAVTRKRILVTFDKHFDRTDIEPRVPSEVLSA